MARTSRVQREREKQKLSQELHHTDLPVTVRGMRKGVGLCIDTDTPSLAQLVKPRRNGSSSFAGAIVKEGNDAESEANDVKVSPIDVPLAPRGYLHGKKKTKYANNISRPMGGG